MCVHGRFVFLFVKSTPSLLQEVCSCKMMVGWVNPINVLLDVVIACAVVVLVTVFSFRLQDDARLVDPRVKCTAIHC